MLTPRLTNCQECANIPTLIDKIDCKLAEVGNNIYNNIVYMLNYPIPATLMLQLIAYRRILIFKYCNPNYAKKYSIDQITNKVIRLTAGCVNKCVDCEWLNTSTSTTTTTITPTTTTTTTTITPTTTTTTTTIAPSTTTTTTTTVDPSNFISTELNEEIQAENNDFLITEQL